MFAEGNSTPRMSCAKLPAGGNVGALPLAAGRTAAVCAAGSVIVFSAASSDESSARPAGNVLVCSMNASTSAACGRVSVPIAFAGIVA